MNDDNELDPIARLRAADPAAGVEARDGFADEVVARATAEPATSAQVTDLAAERARRRPRWLPAAAVAASLVVIGAGGYWAGASTGAPSNVAGGAAPPISLQTAPGAGGLTEQESLQTEAGAADSRMSSTFGAADSMISPWGWGRNTFSSSGLDTTAGTSLAYAFDARTASSAETVAALAAALGVVGTVEQRDGGWAVGPQDGTAPYLWVGIDGTLGFNYSNPLINPWQCGNATVVPEGGTSDLPGVIEPGVVEPCEPTTGAIPSEDAAISALRRLIEASGRDASTFEYGSETWEGSVRRLAQAWPVVDGQRIDQAWTLELTDQGIFSAYGALAGLVELGEYEIVSEQEGFERLSDPRFGAQMTAMPLTAREQPTTDMQQWVPPTEPPATPTAGTALSWPVNDVEIVSARLGLASQWQPDGSVLVVPAYEFTDAEGGTWSVIAVADSKLDFATE